MLNVLLRPVSLLLLFLALPSWSLTRVLLPAIACANRMRLNWVQKQRNLHLGSEDEEVVRSCSSSGLSPQAVGGAAFSDSGSEGWGPEFSPGSCTSVLFRLQSSALRASSLHTAYCRRRLEFSHLSCISAHCSEPRWLLQPSYTRNSGLRF